MKAPDSDSASPAPVASSPLGNQSSLLEKLSPNLRNTLREAVINRDPPTYRAIYDKFRLAERGVSYYAFYRFARPIRAAAELHDLADLSMPAGADMSAILPDLIGRRLLSALNDEETPPNVICGLMSAYRYAVRTRQTMLADAQRSGRASARLARDAFGAVDTVQSICRRAGVPTPNIDEAARTLFARLGVPPPADADNGS